MWNTSNTLLNTYIVPRDQLHKVLVERNACLSVKDGGRELADKVSGDNRILSISKNSLRWFKFDSSQCLPVAEALEHAL